MLENLLISMIEPELAFQSSFIYISIFCILYLSINLEKTRVLYNKLDKKTPKGLPKVTSLINFIFLILFFEKIYLSILSANSKLRFPNIKFSFF